MQIADRKTEQVISGGKMNGSQRKPSVAKPNVRTTDCRKMIEIFLKDPYSVTKDEFLLLQSFIGYRTALGLLEKGKRSKKLEKMGKQSNMPLRQKSEQAKNELTIPTNNANASDNANIEKNKEKSENNTFKIEKNLTKAEQSQSSVPSQNGVKGSNAKEEISQHKPAIKRQSQKQAIFGNGIKKLSGAIAAFRPSTGKAATDKKINSHESMQKVSKGKQTSEEVKHIEEAVISGNADDYNKKSKNKNQSEKATKPKAVNAQGQTKPANTKPKQQSEPSNAAAKSIAAITSTTGKQASKTPPAKINAGDPNSLLQQLGNVSPTQALNAYSQVSALSGDALKKQTEKTQKTIPQIKTPTGLSAIKKNSKAKKTPQTVKHMEPSAFKSAKKGGKTHEGTQGEINLRQGNEPDPEEIMAEAKKYSANTPTMSLTGEADPSQTESFNTEAAQSVQSAQQKELSQIKNEFGESSIYPVEDNTILKAKKGLKSKALKAHKMPKGLEIPVEMEAQLNKSLAPSLKKQIGEQQGKYKTGKEKFDNDVSAERAKSDNKIAELKEETRKKQIDEQSGAKAEVERLRGQWKKEIDGEVSKYDKQAEAETKSKTREISTVKEQKDKEVKQKMAQAEKDANQEYKTAKKNADEKKKEKEKDHENEKKSWFEKAVDWVKDKAQKFIEGLKKAINFIYDGLRKAVKGIFDLAKKAITGLIELGRKMITDIIKGLGAILKVLVKAVLAAFPEISKKICGFIDKAVSKAVNAVNAAADFLKKGVSSVLDFLSSTLDKLLGVIQSLYNGALTFIGMVISGKFKEIMEGIAKLGRAAKASAAHLEGKVWEQLVGVDITKPLGQESAEGTAESTVTKNAAHEKLTENDIELENVETGEIDPELFEDMNLKDGETKQIKGSNDPYTMDSIMGEFDVGKQSEKTGNSFVDGAKMRADNAGKILDQIKQFVIKWLKDNWVKLLLGVLGALAGIVVLEIVTGGAITAALPTLITVITNLMNAAMVVSIVDTIAKAAGYVETYLTQGWAGNIPVAAVALATALAMGLVELAMSLGFKGAGKAFKSTGKKLKQGFTKAAEGTKNLAKAAGTGVKGLLKSGAKIVSKTGSMVIKNGKLVIKSLQKGFSKGVKKLGDLINKVLAKFKFKRFKLERKGIHIRLYGEVNPWVLLADGTVEWKEHEELGLKGLGKAKLGQKVKFNGKKGIVVGIENVPHPSKAVSEILENASDTAKIGKNKELYNALEKGGQEKAQKLITHKESTYELRKGIPDADQLPGFQAHHLFPRELKSDPAIKKFLDEIGFNIEDGTRNGIMLPSKKELRNGKWQNTTIHYTSHGKYTEQVRDKITILADNYKELLKQGVSPDKAKELISKNIDNYISQLKNGLMKGSINLN